MKKILSILLLSVFLFSCSDEDDKICCTVIDTGIMIKYVNDEGENLFEMEGGLEETDITLFVKVDNVWERHPGSGTDTPRGVKTVEREGETYLLIYPSTTFIEDTYSETRVEFRGYEADLIRTKIDKSHSNEIVSEVWYNGELRWEAYDTERMFEVMK